jgi:hypothetical protein
MFNLFKKSLLLFCAFILVFCSACALYEDEPVNTSTPNSATSAVQNTTELQPETTKLSLPTVPPSISLQDEEVINWISDGDGDGKRLAYKPTHRFCYYNVGDFYMRLVDDNDALTSFLEEFYLEKQSQTEEPKTMILKEFVMRFKIPREKFDEATAKSYAATIKLGEDISDEMYELPNADIIYTFDDEIINDYYRRE